LHHSQNVHTKDASLEAYKVLYENVLKVTINSYITKSIKYKQTPGFLQWRDAKFNYGLTFGSPEDADTFAQWIQHAIESSGEQTVMNVVDACVVMSSIKDFTHGEDNIRPDGLSHA
jgi:WH1 domain